MSDETKMWGEEEFLKMLEDNGVDTVCFMGSGYDLIHYKIGQEFYFPYAYYTIMSDFKRGISVDMVKGWIKNWHKKEESDRYKIVQKYEFQYNQLWGNKRRHDKLIVQNLRTGEKIKLKDHEANWFYWCLMCEPI